MSSGLDQDLRTAFAAASEFIEAPGTLADRVRRGTQRRRRRALATAAACAALLLAAGLTYAVAGHSRSPAAAHRTNGARFRLPYGYQVSDVAVGGPYLYVMFGQVEVLAAYDRATGKLIRRVTLPDMPSDLAVGPGGLVWVVFYGNQDGAPSGDWLLSPDLRRHSAMDDGPIGSITPISRTAAWVPRQYGLYRLSMPAPGTTGRETAVLEPGTSIGPPLNTAPGPAALLDGRVVVGVTDGAGLHPRLVISGQPSITYGGGPFTSTGRAVWVVTGGVTTGGYAGPLVRLNGELQPTTPAVVRHSALLSQAADVWSHGDTIWVSLGPQSWAAGPSLACFTAGSRLGRIMTLPVRGSVLALAATRDTVYISTVPAGQYGALSSGVIGYRVPAACR